MRKLGDAAIHMQQSIDEMPIEYILGKKEDLINISSQKPMEIFSDRTVNFLAQISSYLKETQRGRMSQEIATFSFWCRRAHLNELKNRYVREDEIHLGRGLSLHFAPGNIPTQFAYTAVSGLLAGTSVIVRLSQKRTSEEDAIINAFRHVIDDNFHDFGERIIFIRYPHDAKITDFLSSLCDVRVMWGSNDSVNNIRMSPIKPGAVELPFSARDSAAIFSAAEILKTDNLLPLCRDFYNDTYLNDQNACSSPHILYWMGSEEDVCSAKEKFWKVFESVLDEKKWEIQAETAVRKLTAAYVAATSVNGLKIIKNDNRIVRLQVPSVDEFSEESSPEEKSLMTDLWKYSEPGGFFIELQGEDFENMVCILGKLCQTVSVFGIDRKEFAKFTARKRVKGVDRIVPVGHTLDFELTWDGFNMIECMSRKIDY